MMMTVPYLFYFFSGEKKVVNYDDIPSPGSRGEKRVTFCHSSM